MGSALAQGELDLTGPTIATGWQPLPKAQRRLKATPGTPETPWKAALGLQLYKNACFYPFSHFIYSCYSFLKMETKCLAQATWTGNMYSSAVARTRISAGKGWLRNPGCGVFQRGAAETSIISKAWWSCQEISLFPRGVHPLCCAEPHALPYADTRMCHWKKKQGTQGKWKNGDMENCGRAPHGSC